MSSALLQLILFICLLFGFTSAAYCHDPGPNAPPPILGPKNLLPINDGASNMKMIAKIPKLGALYSVYVPNTSNETSSNFHIAHVYGTPYQMVCPCSIVFISSYFRGTLRRLSTLKRGTVSKVLSTRFGPQLLFAVFPVTLTIQGLHERAS